MLLYFLRHGQAGNREKWTGDDAERPLTGKGKKRLAQEGQRLNDLKLDVDAIITSPLVRARQTADVVAKQLGLEDKVTEDARISPGFGMDQLTEIVRGQLQAKAIMFVGHEPDFSQLVGALIGGGRVVCKKGALACVEVDPSSMQGDLLFLIQPKYLTA